MPAVYNTDQLVWLLALAVFIVLFPLLKRFFVFVLDELYEIFIQHNPEEHDHQYH